MTINPADLALPTQADAAFSTAGWVFELKYDGLRILAAHNGDAASLSTRRGRDRAQQFPEIAAALRALPDVVLDGELVMLDGQGIPRFERLVQRTRLRRSVAIEYASKSTPAIFYAFDLLELGGEDRRARPLLERKQLLDSLLKRSKAIRPVTHSDDGIHLFEYAEANGLEGVVAKRAASAYVRGRSMDWLKINTAVGRAKRAERATWYSPKTEQFGGTGTRLT